MEPPEPSSILLRLAAVVVLAVANGCFVAAEYALVGARRSRLEERARAGNRRAALARRALNHLDRFRSSTRLGVTLTSLGLGWIGVRAVAGLVSSAFDGLPRPLDVLAIYGVAVAIAFAFLTLLHVVLGELVPRSLALLHPERVSEWVVIPLLGFTWLMAGPIALLSGVANRLLGAAGVRVPSHHERAHSPEEIRVLVEQSEEGGRLDVDDARLLEGVFEFSEKDAEEVMTPRTDIVALPADATVENAADAVARAGRSRYPVYGDSLDDIVGVVLAKDLLTALRDQPGAPLRSLLRPALFVPGTREVEDVLADMKRLKTHLAVVLDEYGGTAGLVTMEDLLEEIVGPIYDEHDRPVEVAGGDGQLLDGATPITEFNAERDTALDDTAYTTLGGLVFGALGRLPAPGDQVSVPPFMFEVAEMDGRRVKAVRIVEGREGA